MEREKLEVDYSVEFNEKLREKIRARDGYRCRFCDRTAELNLSEFGCKLHVHHVDYCKGHNDEDNLITLCKSCHSHTYTDREFWLYFYQALMRKKQSKQAVNL